MNKPKYNFYYLIFVVFLFSNLSTKAQISQGEYLIRDTSGSKNNEAHSIIQTKDGGYAIAGDIGSREGGTGLIYIVKLDSNAKIEWTRKISVSTLDAIGYSIVQTNDSGYVVVGPGEGGVYIAKLNSVGTVQWNKYYNNGISGNIGTSIIQTKDGGYAITGWQTFLSGGYNIIFMKLNSSGNLMMSKLIGSPNQSQSIGDQGSQIIQTEDGGYAISGTTNESGTGNNFYVIRLDSLGNVVWAKVIGGSYDFGESITETYDKGFAIAGYSASFTPCCYGLVYIVKLDSAGNLKWTKTIGGPYDQGGNSIIQTTDHGLAIVGYTQSFVAKEPSQAVYFIKLDASGNLLYTRVIGGARGYEETGYSVVQTKDKGFAIAGTCQYPDTVVGPTDKLSILFVKLDSTGGACMYYSGGSVGSGGKIHSGDTIYNTFYNVDSNAVIDSGGTIIGVCIPVAFTPPEVTIVTSPSCSGCNGTAVVYAVDSNDNSYSYLWSNGDTTNYAIGLCAGNYTVKILYEGNVIYFDSIKIPPSANPSVNIPTATVTDVSCYKGNNGSATAIASGGTAPYSYIWFPSGQTSKTATTLTAGIYTVVTSDSNKCAGIDTVTITQPSLLTVSTSPNVSIEAGKDTTVTALANGGTPPYTYQWIGGISSTNYTVSPLITSTYTVVATDSNGCTAMAYVTVEVLCGEVFIPDAFSPNGDGRNDYLYVRNNCIKTMELIIFDRWGNKVFESTSQSIPWDGTFKGEPMNTSTYVYYLSATMYDGTIVQKKGNVALIR